MKSWGRHWNIDDEPSCNIAKTRISINNYMHVHIVHTCTYSTYICTYSSKPELLELPIFLLNGVGSIVYIHIHVYVWQNTCVLPGDSTQCKGTRGSLNVHIKSHILSLLHRNCQAPIPADWYRWGLQQQHVITLCKKREYWIGEVKVSRSDTEWSWLTEPLALKYPFLGKIEAPLATNGSTVEPSVLYSVAPAAERSKTLN